MSATTAPKAIETRYKGYVWYHSAADGVDARKLDAALSFARAARFEHGETPGVNR